MSNKIFKVAVLLGVIFSFPVHANSDIVFVKYKSYLIPITATVAQTSQTIEYKYDALGRLIKVENQANGDKDYDYDPAGNRTSVTKPEE